MTKILCDRCKLEFEGEDWLAEKLGEVLCPDCYKDSKEEIYNEGSITFSQHLDDLD